MSDLRKKLIRLAAENPDLRPKLLPLLAGKTVTGAVEPTAVKPKSTDKWWGVKTEQTGVVARSSWQGLYPAGFQGQGVSREGQ